MGGPSPTGYAKSGDLSIAYQVIGDGPLDVVFVPGFVSHLDIGWELEPFVKTLTRLSSFARVIVFDKRGTGLSDRTAGLPTLAERMDDIRAVMDAAGSERAAIVGLSEGGPSSMLFAATFPERTAALVLWLTAARPPLDERDEATRSLNTWIDDYIAEHWGDGTAMRWLISGCPADAATDELLARYERNAATPTAARSVFRRSSSSDVRPFLSSIGAPTLLIAHTGDPVMPIDAVRSTVAQLPGAQLIEVPIAAHVCWDAAATPELDLIEEFLTGTRHPHEPDRVLATVLYTDIVSSTERAAAIGDDRWRRLLDAHDAAVRRQLVRFRGREVNTTGDGFLAAFDGPARASSARSQSSRTPRRSASTCVPVSTPASARSEARTSPVSPSTSVRASPPRRMPVRSSSPGPCTTSSRDPTSSSPTGASTSSRVSRSPGSCSPCVPLRPEEPTGVPNAQGCDGRGAGETIVAHGHRVNTPMVGVWERARDDRARIGRQRNSLASPVSGGHMLNAHGQAARPAARRIG